MKKYNFQIQGYEPIERCVWVAYFDASAQTPDMHRQTFEVYFGAVLIR